MPPASQQVYSATYSNVPVYEFNCNGNHVMRRRSDDWINATHILKVADYDKPARTRILEREVQKGVHEKVQGGYGKYQGTWIPLQDGKELASKNGVLEKLRPIFDYVPGDRSPPPAPKHATAASSKPRQPRAPAQRRQPAYSHHHHQDYDAMDIGMQDGETPDDVSIIAESFIDDSGYGDFPRKRRRIEDTMTPADKEHQLWASELLDYFMLRDDPHDSLLEAPKPPEGADLNRPIDDKGHTALHWAAAMGDIEVVKDLIRRDARIDVQAKNGETPLMRAVVFTNCYDLQVMDKLAGLLVRTAVMQEWGTGSTVFHHIANLTERKSKYPCARYYMDCILDKMVGIMSPDAISRALDTLDYSGEPAITIAARNGARHSVRSLMGRGASVDIPNRHGETADQLIVQLNRRRQERSNNRPSSSSPAAPDLRSNSFAAGGPVQPVLNGTNGGLTLDPMLSQNSLDTQGQTDDDSIYRSEQALALTSSIMPAIWQKTKMLAVNIDAEVAEKEAELAEAERVAAMRRHEIEILKRQAHELRAKQEEQIGLGFEGDDELEAEVNELIRQCEALTEEEMNFNLRELVAEEEQEAQDSPPADLLMEDEADTIRRKLELFRELRQLEKERKNLKKTIVLNLSVAGMGVKGAEFKRLIQGALNVREEDVESILPDIVQELEDYQLENVGVA